MPKKHMSSGFKLMWTILAAGVVFGVSWGVWELTPGKQQQRLLDHAREMMAEKAWGESIVALRKALELYPNDKGVHYMLMQSLFADGKAEQGLAEMESILLLPPFNDGAYRARFNEYYGMVRLAGKPAQMHEQATKMRDRLPEASAWMPDFLDARAHFIDREYDKATELFGQLAESGINTYLFKLDMAQALLAAGKFGEAEEVYKVLLKSNPDSLDVLNGLAMSLTFQGKRDEALNNYIRAALIGEPPALPALLSGAAFALNQNRLSEAKKYFVDRLAKYYPEDQRGILTTMQYNVQVGDRAAFFAALENKTIEMDNNVFALLLDWCVNRGHPLWALEILQDYVPQGMDADIGAEYSALAMLRLRRVDEARKLVGSISDVDRKALLLAEIDMQSGRFDAAEKAFGKLVEAGKDAPTRISQAAAQRMLAIKATRKALDNAELLPRARVLLSQGKATEVLDLLAGAKNQDAETGLLGVMALMQLDRKKEAEAKLDVLTRQYPEREDVWLLWARVVSEDDSRQALKGLLAAISGKADGPRLRSMLGEVQYKLGQKDAAIATWKRVSEMWPGTLSANVDNVFRAQAYMARGDWGLAVSTWDEVIKIAPEDPLTLNNLAYSLLKSGGDLQRAEQLAAQALLIRPGNAAIEDTLNEVRKAIRAAKTTDG